MNILIARDYHFTPGAGADPTKTADRSFDLVDKHVRR